MRSIESLYAEVENLRDSCREQSDLIGRLRIALTSLHGAAGAVLDAVRAERSIAGPLLRLSDEVQRARKFMTGGDAS